MVDDAALMYIYSKTAEREIKIPINHSWESVS